VYVEIALFQRAWPARVQDFLVLAALAILGIGYVTVAALSNRSVIVGLLGASEVLALFGAGFAASLAARRSSVALAVLVALVFCAGLAYPWMHVERLLLRLRRWTGRP
jgi:hypothetical protein